MNLIKRFSKKRVEISKVWKHCHRIAILASQVYISSTILKPIEEIQEILKDLLTAYVTLNNTDSFLQDVVESVRSIIRLAETASHIYVFCEVFQEQVSDEKLNSFFFCIIKEWSQYNRVHNVVLLKTSHLNCFQSFFCYTFYHCVIYIQFTFFNDKHPSKYGIQATSFLFCLIYSVRSLSCCLYLSHRGMNIPKPLLLLHYLPTRCSLILCSNHQF